METKALVGERLQGEGHWHVSGSRSEAAKAENIAERAAKQAEDRQQAFAAESERIDEQILQARGAMLQGVNEQADFAIKQIDAEQKNYEKSLGRAVDDGKLETLDAALLVVKHQELTDEKKKAVETGRQIALIRQQSEAQQRTFEYKADDLRFADELATTQAEHRRIQLDILDAVYEQKRLQLEANLKIAEQNENQDEINRIKAEQARLPTEKAQDRTRTLNGTMNPLEAWARSVPQTADQINEALQSIEARGLDNLASALTDVISGTKSLGEAFSDIARSIIADIIQMTIRMLIFRAISAAIGGIGGGGATGSGPVNINTFGGPRASGGPVRAGTTYLVGEKGPELWTAPGNGTIIPNAPNIRAAANSNMPQRIDLVVGFGDAPAFAPYVQQVAGQAASVAIKVSTDHTNNTLRQIAKPKLNGR